MHKNAYRLPILLLCLLATGKNLMAQHAAGNPWCGTTEVSPWLEWYREHRHNLVPQRSDETLYVPVLLHLVGNDAGTGHMNLDRALNAICRMNEHFQPADIEFYLTPGNFLRYHNNSAWFEHDWADGGQMIDQNNEPGFLNAYVVSDPAGTCGYSWKGAIVMGIGCSGDNTTTWSHEAGHHFSLPHPFRGWENQDWNFSLPAPNMIGNRAVERTDGSNCDEAGDYFCDTPPDYLSDRWLCDDNQESVQLQHDPNNVAFRSDATLLMGYAQDECQSRFTEEQMAAMRANLLDEHSDYLQITALGPGLDDDAQVQLISPIDSQVVQFNNFELHWAPLPGATMYVVEVSFNENFFPRLFYRTFYNEYSALLTQNIPPNRVIYWKVRAYNEWDVCNPNDNVQVGILKTRNLSATNELERNLFAELSPNPVPGGTPATLRLTADESMEALLSVTDATGRVCYRQDLRIYPDQNSILIPTDNLNAGVYIVSVQNAQGTLLKRLSVVE